MADTQDTSQYQASQEGENGILQEGGYAEVAADGWAYDADGNPYDPTTGEYYDEATYTAQHPGEYDQQAYDQQAYAEQEAAQAGMHSGVDVYVPGASEGEAVVTDQTALHYAAYEGNEEALANYLAPSKRTPP